ncbi:MAG: apolipoprotein N-acyltransferase [Alphaproteobacteria bacterium]
MKVYVNVNDKRWNKYKIDYSKIANAAVLPAYKESEVSITLVDDDEIHALNREYRNMDKPTNVLSFELGDDVLLGDIFISLDTVVREAKEANITVEEHVAHLVVHGVLHVQGYDHITDKQARVMESKEIKILKKLGIKNPYKDEIVSVKIVWWKYLLCAVFGGVASFGFAPFNMWWLTVFGIGAMYYLVTQYKNMSFKQAWFLSMPFGAMYCVSMFWWALHSIYVVPELEKAFAIWTVPAIFGLGIAGVFIFALPFALIRAVRIKTSALPFLFGGVCALFLWFREWMLTGFPWNPVSNILLKFPLIANSMSVWGALGLSFVITGGIAAVIELIRNYKKIIYWIAVFVFFILFGLGMFFGNANIQDSNVKSNKNIPMIRIVQPALNQSVKMAKTRNEAIEIANKKIQDLIDLTGNINNVDLIVYPETMYPFVVLDDDEIPIAKHLNKTIVFGANTFKNNRMYNSMVFVNSNGEMVHVYDKYHLVPFGEYKPLGILPAPVDLAKGKGREIIKLNYNEKDNVLIAPAVCYEIVFSGAVANDENIDFIINITNDNWFGKTPGTFQHLDMVRRYAIESGLAVVRANYSGISAFVSPDGKIVSMLPVGKQGFVDGQVYGSHITLYRVLGPDWLMLWIVLFVVISVFVFSVENKKS